MRKLSCAFAALAFLTASGCALRPGDDTTAEPTASTEAAILAFKWVVFDNPYGDGTPNPAANIRGEAHGNVATNPTAVSGLKGWTVTGMTVANLPPNRTFGAHAHALTCDNNQGGGHYENVAGSIDPTNSEIWLDFTTDARGHGEVHVLSPFAVRPGGVQSIVVHTNPTDPATGKAGAKLACANLALAGAAPPPAPPADAGTK